MEMDQNLLKKIEDYLMGKLSEEEVAIFEREMAADADLNEEVQRMKLIRDSIEFYGDENLKKKFDVIHEEVTKKKSALTYHINTGKMIAAAAIIVSLVSSVFLLNTFENKNIEDIYEEYYEIPAINNVSRDNDEPLDLAESYYKKNDYERAFLAFSEEKVKNPDQLNLVFYMAICAHETGRDSTARVLLEEIIRQDHPAMLDDAKWYIAMNYLSRNEPAEAKKYLLQLKNDSSSFYSLRAGEILGLQFFSE